MRQSQRPKTYSISSLAVRPVRRRTSCPIFETEMLLPKLVIDRHSSRQKARTIALPHCIIKKLWHGNVFRVPGSALINATTSGLRSDCFQLLQWSSYNIELHHGLEVTKDLAFRKNPSWADNSQTDWYEQETITISTRNFCKCSQVHV